MAYPGEQTHVSYLDYVQSVANGETQGPQLTKEQWLAQKKNPVAPIKPEAVSGVVDALMKKR